MTSPPVRFGHRLTSPGTNARRRCSAAASRQGSSPSTDAVTGVLVQQPEQDAQRGRLAGPVRPQEAVDLAALDRQVELVEGPVRAEGLDQARHRDRRRHLPHPQVGSTPSDSTAAQRLITGPERRSPARCVCGTRGVYMYTAVVKYFPCILDTPDVEDPMSSRPPSGLERLWSREEQGRAPRLGLSLERIVESGIELADGDGLEAVSMKRVAERLGFTTMALYRYVSSKDDLLLLMHDTAWRPPPGLRPPGRRLARRHRPLDARAVRDHAASSLARRGPAHRPGRHSEPDHVDGPRPARAVRHPDRRVPEDRASAAAERLRVRPGAHRGDRVDGARQGSFAVEQATEAFGELLRTIVDAERFPALAKTVEGGGFAGGRPFPDFDFGLDLILDGIACLVRRQTPD